MAEFEDDLEFNSEQVQKIAESACQTVIGNDSIVYQKDKASQWSQQIIELCIKELAKLNKEFKYIVTCVLQQNIGAGIQTAATAFWNTGTDGLISVQLANNTYYCIVTVFCM